MATQWGEKARLAKESFKEVLASDEHEDSKAQRILTAMAFITAAAALIFAELSRAQIAEGKSFPILTQFAYVPLSFFLFVGFMILGTLYFLAALGPSFNIPTPWTKTKARAYPQSLLFSQLILEEPQSTWEQHWASRSPAELEEELAKNYVIEAYLLAQKVKFKVCCMRTGKLFYKIALGFFAMLVVPVFTADTGHIRGIAALMFAIISLQDLIERATAPPGWNCRLWDWDKQAWKNNLLSLNSLLSVVEVIVFTFLIIVMFKSLS